jgi:hypothetical protein
MFCHFMYEHFKLSPNDAHRAFKLMDLNDSGNVDRAEVLCALRCAESNLFLEDVRKKVRQSFRSIRASIQDAKDNRELQDLDQVRSVSAAASSMQPLEDVRKKPNKHYHRNTVVVDCVLHNMSSSISMLQEEPDDADQILRTLQFQEGDIRQLLALIDVDGDNRVSTFQLVKGIRLFAPSAVEELRLHLLNSHASISEGFETLSAEWKDCFMTECRQMDRLFLELAVPAHINASDVWDLVESRRHGGVCIDELIAALNSGSTGSQMRLSSRQRDQRARQQVKWQLAPFRRNAEELRGELRSSASFHRKTVDPVPVRGPRPSQEEDAPRPTTGLQFPAARSSFRKVRCAFEKRKTDPEDRLLTQVHSYYATASVRMCQDVPLMQNDTLSRVDLYKDSSKHRKHLGLDSHSLC